MFHILISEVSADEDASVNVMSEVYDVTFKTHQYNGEWPDNSAGSIYEFSPNYRQFPLGMPTPLSAGNYEIQVVWSGGIINGRKYGFGYWTTTGSSVQVQSTTSANTILSVSGSGTVEATFYRWDFTIEVTPPSQSVAPGDKAFYAFKVQAVPPVPNDGQENVWSGVGPNVNNPTLPPGITQAGNGYVTLNKDQTSGILYPYLITSVTTIPDTYKITWVGYIEFTSSQNWRTQDATLVVQPKSKSDLTVIDIRTSPSNPNIGDTVTIYSTISNNGPGDLTSGIRVAAWIDRNATVYLGNFHILNLAADQSIEKSFDNTWKMTAGSHEISVMADANDAVQETSEDNNWGYKQIGGPKPEISTEISLDLSPHLHQPEDRFSITMSGRLTRKDTASGVSPARVQLAWTGGMSSVTTDSEGRYSYTTYVGPYSPGTYVFTASFEGYETPTENLLNSKADAYLIIQWPKPTFEISWLVSDYAVYIQGSTIRLWAQVKNIGTITIGSYELQADFFVVNPSGSVISAGTGWNSWGDLEPGGITTVENTDNTWAIPEDALPGWYTSKVTITHAKTSTSQTRETPDIFGINSLVPPDFQITASPEYSLVTQGQATTIEVVVISIGGYDKEVSLSSSLTPSGLIVTFSQNRLVPTGISSLTMGTSAQTQTGTFDFVVIASDGTRTHTCSVTIRVNPSSVLLSINQMKTDKTSYSTTDQVSFIFEVTNVGASSVTFRSKIQVQDLGVWSMPDYSMLLPQEKQSFYFPVSYTSGWPVGTQNWKVLLVGPSPSDSCTYFDTGFVSSFVIAGGTTFTVRLKAEFLPPSGDSSRASITLDNTLYHVHKDQPWSTNPSIRKLSGVYSIYCHPDVIAGACTYVFSHWKWDRLKNSVFPASETSESTTITITGDGELTAVLVKFTSKLSFPTQRILEPGDNIDFTLTIDCFKEIKRSTVYCRIMVNGPPGAGLLGHEDKPVGDSGIQPYTLGTTTPFFYRFGPITENSIPGTYTVSAVVFDRPDQSQLSWIADLAFTVDVGISYVEIFGPTDHRIIHVHYSKEDVEQGKAKTIKEMFLLHETVGLVLSTVDSTSKMAAAIRAHYLLKSLGEMAKLGKEYYTWFDSTAKRQEGEPYDFTIVQMVGERGKYYEGTPISARQDIQEEIGWAIAGVTLSIALTLAFPPAAPLTLLATAILAFRAFHTVALYLFDIDRPFLDLGSPAFCRFVPKTHEPTSSLTEFALAPVTTYTQGTIEEPLYLLASLPFRAFSPVAQETAADIVAISPAQIMSAKPGATITITVSYRLSQAYAQNQINQLMLICDFAGWPPNSGSYFSIYGGIPPESGITGTQQIVIHVPIKPGSYYCWFAMTTGDDLERAANQFKGDLGTQDPHMRIDLVRDIHLESEEDNNASTNKGQIMFDGSWYSLSTDISMVDGSYPIDYSPDSGYEFVRWERSGGISVSNQNSQSTTATVSGDGTLTAIYQKIQCTVVFNMDPTSGSVTADGVAKYDGDMGVYVHGSRVHVVAVAPQGYSFVEWQRTGNVDVDNSGSDDTYMTVTCGGTLKAVYSQIECSVTFYTDPSTVGTISFEGETCSHGQSDTFSYGTSGLATASAPVGWEFDHWVVTSNVEVSSATANPTTVTITCGGTLKAVYSAHYLVTFEQMGLDATANSVVIAVNGVPKNFGDLPFSFWADEGATVTYSYNNTVSSSTSGKRFRLDIMTGQPSPITVTGYATVIGNYKTQHQITFDQTGVGVDYLETVVTIDGTGYEITDLPESFWWDKDSAHSFSFQSPLVVDAGKRYVWTSTTGLSTLQSDTLTITSSGSVIGNYTVQAQYEITFDQTGVNTDFTGTVVVIDGNNYGVDTLPVSFFWDAGSIHSFAFQSPLVVTPNAKKYVWTSTSGLSPLQTSSITVSTSGSVTGNYKTQYYLTLETSPSGVATPSGEGWYNAGTPASISTDEFVPGGSRYRFTGWTTGDMSEITDPNSPSTTVLMDEAKTVTANYVLQYQVTFTQTGVGTDFTGSVVTVNGTPKALSDLPFSIWVDTGNNVSYSYEVTLSSSIYSKRFRLNNVTGPTSPITVTADATVTGNYVTQHLITFDQTGLDSSATDTVVTADGDEKIVGHLPFTKWVDNMSSVTYFYSNPILSTEAGKRFKLVGVAGPVSPINITGSVTVTGNYKIQYRTSFVFKLNDASEILYKNPTQIRIFGAPPNNTLITITSYSDAWLDDIEWEAKEILWQGNNVVPDPKPDFSPTPHGTWIITCRVYKITAIIFNDYSGRELYTPPTYATFTAPNDTEVSLHSFSSCTLYLQNGTYTFKTIIWQSNNVVDSPPQTFDPTNGNPSINCRVYSFQITCQDNSGHPLANASLEVLCPQPNGTALLKCSSLDGTYFASQIQNGTYTITVYWQDVNVHASTIPLDSNVDEILRCRVYKLTVCVIDEKNETLSGANISLYRNGTLLNGKYSLPTAPTTNATGYTWPQMAEQHAESYKVKAVYTSDDVRNVGWSDEHPLTEDATWPPIQVEGIINVNVKTVDWKHEVIGGAYVEIIKNKTVQAWGYTDPNGWINFIDIVPDNLIFNVFWTEVKVNQTIVDLASDSTITLRCKVYNVIIGFRDANDNAITNPSEYILEFLNGTDSLVKVFAFRCPIGNITLKSATWHGSEVAPSPNRQITVNASQQYFFYIDIFNPTFSVRERDQTTPLDSSIVCLRFPNGTSRSYSTDSNGEITLKIQKGLCNINVTTIEGCIAQVNYPILVNVTKTYEIPTWIESKVFTVISDETSYEISVTANSTVSNFAFNSTEKRIDFEISGPAGTMGACNITIPKGLVASPSDIKVYINEQETDFALTENTDSYHAYVTYQHSTHVVTISFAPPSPPSIPLWILLVVIAVSVTIAALITIKRRTKKA